MTKKIFQSIAFVVGLVFIALIGLIMGLLYTHFLSVQFDQMHAQAVLAVHGIEQNGEKYLKGLTPEGYRLTWIDPEGTVLYDSNAEISSMENHLQREEIQQALASGEGESTRYSTTLLERQLYVAKKAGDGSIVRISDSQHTIMGLLVGMLQPILVVAVIAFCLSLILAYRLSKRIIEPLNGVDPDRPEQLSVYKELEPLMERLTLQQDLIRQQTRQLRQKQQEFDASTANMSEGLLILNEKKEIISMNRAASDILHIPMYAAGKSVDEFSPIPEIGAIFEEMIPGEREETTSGQKREESTSGHKSEETFVWQKSDQTIPGTKSENTIRHQKCEKIVALEGKQYQLHASPVITSGHVGAVVIFILDITMQLEAEQMRREFTANVSHELKTPLQTISGSAELIAAGIVREEDLCGFGQRIYDESRRLIALFDDVIGLSRLDESAEGMRMEEVDLYAVAEQVVANLHSVAEKADVQLSLSGESALMMGDVSLLGSIVYNLCDNAIKYSHAWGKVKVSVLRVDDKVSLTVADNGIGIAKEDQDRIFERFYRVDKARSKEAGGTGLGLSIVKHAVKYHKGEISLQSQPQKGTTITVVFPTEPA